MRYLALAALALFAVPLSGQSDSLTVVTVDNRARLCPQPNCGQRDHIIRVPTDTKLAIRGTREVDVGLMEVRWFRVCYLDREGWISEHDTDRAKRGGPPVEVDATDLPPCERDLSTTEQRRYFKAVVKAEDRADHEAEMIYPTHTGCPIPWEQIRDNIEPNAEYVRDKNQEYRRRVRVRFGVSQEQHDAILARALKERWPMPEPTTHPCS